MAFYRVRLEELYTRDVKVQAESPAEAIEKVSMDGDDIEESLESEYVEVLEVSFVGLWDKTTKNDPVSEESFGWEE